MLQNVLEHGRRGTKMSCCSYSKLGLIWFKTIRWCIQHANNVGFKELPQTPIHSEASLSESQYIRSSTIIYNLTSADTFTQFLCESGETGICGTGSAIQHVNIRIGKPRMFSLLFLCKSQNFILQVIIYTKCPNNISISV